MDQRSIAALLLCLLLAACGNSDDAARKAATGENELPAPDAVSGSVTGMPNPGKATVIPADVPEQPSADAVIVEGDDPIATHADAIAVEPPPDDAGAGPDAAVAVLRDYYAAINARDFSRAHAAWRGNPQAPAQFAQGFADIAGVSVEIGPPGPVGAGAGQRYIDLPVRLEITRTDGRMERQSGSYTLQRSVVDGGDPQWKIARTSLGP